MTVPQGGTPHWAQSVSAFTSAISQSAVYTTAQQVNFPDTTQLSGVCGGLLSGSSMTNGLMANGNPAVNGPAGALVPGTQGFTDTLCGLAGGAGVNTTPQSIVSGATDVSNSVNATPIAAGTMAMAPGAPTGNSALDAINGTKALATSVYNILNCGCGTANSPANLTPTQVQANATQLSNAYNNSAMASGIVGLGQATNGVSGNVAIDAINGGQAFANTMYSITSLCGICNLGGVGTAEFTGALTDAIANNFGGPFGTSVSPTDIIDAAQTIADAITSSPYIGTIQSVIGSSGNIGVDAVSGLGHSTSVNNSQHVGHVSLTTAQSVNLLNQNLLVSDDFATASTVMSDGSWSWVGTAGSAALGAAKCVCNGTQDDMVSCEIPVLVGESIEIAAEIRWSGLTYTGTIPIAVGVQMYRQCITAEGITYLDVGGYDVATVISPPTTGPTAGTTNSNTGADGHIWLGVAGEFTVPAGVDQLRLRFRVYDTVTAGIVFFDDGEMLKTDLIASECVPGVGQTVDNIVTQLYGSSGTGFTQNAAAVALANTANSLASVNAKVAALAAEGNTGAVAGDDFNWVGIMLGPGGSSNWAAGFYSPPGTTIFPPGFDPGNYYAANGSEAYWVAQPAPGPVTYEFIWTGTDSVSTTDYQVIQLVLNSTLRGAVDPGGVPLPTYVDLVGRSNSSLTSYSVARIGSDGSAAIGYATSGGYNWLWTGTCTVPGQGAVLTFYCGNKATTDPWNFILKLNDLTLANFDDTAHMSPFGSSNRCWGWGGYATSSALIQGTPASINQWLAQDQ
jgi:hypothetical protein